MVLLCTINTAVEKPLGGTMNCTVYLDCVTKEALTAQSDARDRGWRCVQESQSKLQIYFDFNTKWEFFRANTRLVDEMLRIPPESSKVNQVIVVFEDALLPLGKNHPRNPEHPFRNCLIGDERKDHISCDYAKREVRLHVSIPKKFTSAKRKIFWDDFTTIFRILILTDHIRKFDSAIASNNPGRIKRTKRSLYEIVNDIFFITGNEKILSRQ